MGLESAEVLLLWLLMEASRRTTEHRHAGMESLAKPGYCQELSHS
jgi:hypothetical protein